MDHSCLHQSGAELQLLTFLPYTTTGTELARLSGRPVHGDRHRTCQNCIVVRRRHSPQCHTKGSNRRRWYGVPQPNMDRSTEHVLCGQLGMRAACPAAHAQLARSRHSQPVYYATRRPGGVAVVGRARRSLVLCCCWGAGSEGNKSRVGHPHGAL